jgi:hypothetical protein
MRASIAWLLTDSAAIVKWITPPALTTKSDA